VAVGNQATTESINNQLTSYSVALRTLCQNISNLNQYVGNMGTAGLELAGYDAADAASVINFAAILNTVPAVFFGTATQATQYNFSNALAPLYAGQ